MTRLKTIWQHPWIVAACNILLVMALYTLSRLVFVWVNHDLYPDISAAHLGEMLRGGWRFDLTALLYLNSLYLILMLLPLPPFIRNKKAYQTTATWFYWVPNIIGLLVNCVDMVYFRFTDRRTTCTFFSEFQNEGNLLSIFCQSVVQYWYVTLFALIACALLVLLTRKKSVSSYRWSAVSYYICELALMLATIYFVIIGIRGGFGKYTRPITISNALQYTNSPRETAIVLNTPFSLMKSLENETYVHPHYMSDAEMEQIFSPVHTPSALGIQHSNDNVVVLILESFGKEYIDAGYTPFLDSLFQHSKTYRYSYASGRKSIDAMPSVLSSIPMLIEPFIVTPYSTNQVSSIADCLGREGYTTAFFHGAPNGSMGFQAYARAAGFGAYYGMDEYDGPEAFDGTWAIWDEEFLQYYARTMSSMREPFMTAVFTASSHHPFRVPKRYEGVFPQGPLPIHQCIGYSDNALRKFFDYAKTQPWYDHTLFVITADHTNENALPAYNNARGLFSVPIAFYYPGREWNTPYDEEQAVSQVDIMPSVLAFLGYGKPFFAFGEDALTQTKQHPYAVCYNHPMYQIMSADTLILYDGQRPATNDMERYLQAYIQQYISRMISNRLTVNDGRESR
ncbi:MAG: LTA synthase family protein [Paludibacteraceae bacterium]|nr:LTA synthase family protein [Paludibacteraceae bacterium]